MSDDLISRQAAQQALLNCGEIMFNPDKQIAAEALDRVPTAGPIPWISVKDKLPIENTNVLTCDEAGVVFMGFRFNDEFYGDVKDCKITHWMPLPEPPEGE